VTSVGIFKKSFRKQELHLQAQRPVGAVIRRHHVVERLDLGVHRQLAQVEDLPHAAAERHGPAVVAVRLPVGGDDRRTGEVQPVREVVVEEGLEQEVVVAGIVARADRSDVVDQGAVHPRIAFRQVQRHEGRSQPHRSLPSRSLLLVGSCAMAPTPQISPLALAGDRNAVN